MAVTPGASIAWRSGEGSWHLYTEALPPEAGARLSFKAVRYGYQESAIVGLPAAEADADGDAGVD